jgi:molecular chaperone DnaJ
MAALGQDQDLYALLGVRRDADALEIKAAFRRLARMVHPDVSSDPDGEARFRALVTAYQVLSDPRARLDYDRRGIVPSKHRLPARRSGSPPVDLRLEWYEGSRGVLKAVDFEEPVLCVACEGSGVLHGIAPPPCTRCNGRGWSHVERDGPDGRLRQFEWCSECEGLGHETPDPCPDCGATGRSKIAHSVRVRVPGGVQDGDMLEVDGLAQRFRLRVGDRPADSRLLLTFAGLAFVCALALMLYLATRS